MNDHSKRILSYMLILTSKYRNEEISFSYLIDSFSGSIDALEEKLPFDWDRKWVMKMADLDTYLALGLEAERKPDILEDLMDLDQLIQELL